MYSKKLPTLFISVIYFWLFTFHLSLLSQTANPSCDGKRYSTNVFTDTVQTIIQYGANSDLAGNGQKLFMNVVEPKGDTVSKRPIVVLAFGGGFVAGARTDKYMLDLSKSFALRGYVAVSIDYRLIPFFLINGDSSVIANGVVQAVQDMRASVRYFIKDARTNSKFRIDTNNIFIGGLSAGAITAMHTAYLDTTRNVPTWILNSVRAQGGIDGISGNPGYTFKVKGVFSLSGGLYGVSAFRAGDPSYISIHGTADNTVPYGLGPNVYKYYNDGDGTCSLKTTSLGIPTLHVAVTGSDHTEFYEWNDPKDGFNSPNIKYPGVYAAFEAKAIVFMKRLVCGENPNVTPTNNIVENFDSEIFPNPSDAVLNVRIADGNYAAQWQTELIDVTGKRVATQKFDSNQFSITRNNMPSGLYFLRITNTTNNFSTVKKVIFE